MRSRYRGCMLGVAVGDALGASVEGWTGERIGERFGRVTEMRRTERGLPAGRYTDDFEMTWEVADSIARTEIIVPEDIARGFLEWYSSDPISLGRTTIASMELLKQGAHWNEAGQRVHEEVGKMSAGNGSLMRTAPVALAARSDPDQLRDASMDVSRITHAHPLCIDACVVYDSFLADLLIMDRKAAWARLLELTEWAYPAINEALKDLLDSDGALDSSGYVISTLKVACWSLMRTDGLRSAIEHAVNLGGDTDTAAAVTGGLAGAYYGEEAIPDTWLQALDVNVHGVDDIRALADRLHELSEKDGSLPQ